MTVAGKKYVDCIVLGTDSVDAEDSSYDSDFEAEDSVGSTNIHSQVDLQVATPKHSSVFRTASDTLAAEYAEYVTVLGSPPVPTPGYTARVEFALKLGYTERLVQTAMEKLGPDPEQNELLAELIKLGASRSPKSVVTVEEPNTVVHTDFGFNENNTPSTVLRPVVIDGSNVAMSHGNKKIFSCRGIKICVDWFRARGHREITVFVPKWRKEAPRIDNPITDQEILEELERDRLLVFTPSRLIGGKRMICYDDRYILRLAAEIDGIVVSNDNYRDLALENSEFRKVIEDRILMYTFVNDRFMPPDDPLGRSGPTLNNFLKAFPTKTDPATPCPYAKKCTYGNKCKFRHPERGCYPQKSVTEKLEEHVQKHLHLRGSVSSPVSSNSISTTLLRHKPLCKAGSTTSANMYNQALLSVAKSKSAENIGIQPPINPVVHRTQTLPATSSQGFPSSHRLLGRMSKSDAEQINKHKTLQRQLGSSTAAQIRQMEQALEEAEWGSSSQQNTMASSRAQRRPLIRHSSNELPYRSARRDHAEEVRQHQHVRRNVSAPDYRQPDYSISDSEIRSDILYNRLYDTLPREEVIDLLIDRREIYEICSVLYPEGLVRRAMLLVPFTVDSEEVFSVIMDILFTKSFKQ